VEDERGAPLTLIGIFRNEQERTNDFAITVPRRSRSSWCTT
jgi:hypothetical protein